MGAPKQRWTAEEEAALKAGIARYGAGKWSTILKDPEFGTILLARSNVDLKDKWRNMNVMANGWGSRHRARLALKNNQLIPKPNDTSIVPSVRVECDMEIDVKPLSISNGPLQNGSSEKPISRLDSLILDSIANLKEPRGSSRATIAAYIEKRYSAPPDLERLLAADLKLLTDNGKLIKVKHQYRIAPVSSPFGLKKEPSPLPLEQKQNSSPRAEINTTKVLTKAQIDAELEKMRSMTAQEAAAAAARAVAKAEAAIAEAEEAAREAEAAEADAEEAKVFAAAAMKALSCPALCT